MKEHRWPFGPIVEWFGVYLPLNILERHVINFWYTVFGMLKNTLPPLISVNRDLNLQYPSVPD